MFTRAIEDRFHEHAARARVLSGGIDRDGSYTSDDGALVQTVAAHDMPARLRDDAVKTGMRKHHRKQADGHLRRGDVGWDSMVGIDLPEGLEANASANFRIAGLRLTYDELGFRAL
jgi:hypothetical protein